MKGTAHDCKPCPCPNQGACIQLQDEQIVCLECPTGYAGPQCEFCGDGYFGDPTGQVGPKSECQPCHCNENIGESSLIQIISTFFKLTSFFQTLMLLEIVIEPQEHV